MHVTRLSRIGMAIGLIAIVGILLSACGGSGERAEPRAIAFPPFTNAELLGSAVPPQEQLDKLNVQLSAPGASLYRTGDDLDTVSAFYADGVKADGWTVPLTSPISDAASISIMHKDSQIAAVMSLTAAMAKMVESAITSQGLTFDATRLGDDDVVILESHFTCDEPDVQVCLDALTQTTGT